MHALIRARADLPARVKVVEVTAKPSEELVAAAPVAQELLGVEQRVQRRPELRVDREGALERTHRLGQSPRDLGVARAEVLVGLAQGGLRGDGPFKGVRGLLMPPCLLEARPRVGERLRKRGHQPRRRHIMVVHL